MRYRGEDFAAFTAAGSLRFERDFSNIRGHCLVESGTRYLLLKMLALRAENVSARIDKLKIDGYSKVVAESRI